MSNNCSGCNRLADLEVKNSNLFLCTPCHKLLWGIPVRAIRKAAAYCPECDSPMYHGQQFCILCIKDVLDWIADTMGVESLDDNPFVYELLLPHIRFLQSMYQYKGAGAPPHSDFEYTTYLKGLLNLHTISFQHLDKDFRL